MSQLQQTDTQPLWSSHARFYRPKEEVCHVCSTSKNKVRHVSRFYVSRVCELHWTTRLRSGTHSLLTNGANGRHPAQHASTCQRRLFHKRQHSWQFWVPGDSLQHNTDRCIWYNNRAPCSFRKLSKHLSFSRPPFVISHVLPPPIFLWPRCVFLSHSPIAQSRGCTFQRQANNRKLRTPLPLSLPLVARSAERSQFCEQIWSWKFGTTVSQVTARLRCVQLLSLRNATAVIHFLTNFSKKRKR